MQQSDTDPMSSAYQPLSLQQSSMNCIITNLECYPSDLLALLPLHFRRELLLVLPPADIFQLEHTNFVEGINMEDEIWNEVCKHYDFEVAITAHRTYQFPYLARHYDLNVPISSYRKLRLPCGINSAISSPPLFNSWKAHFVSYLLSFLSCIEPFQLSKNHADMCDRCSKHFGWRNYIVLLQMLFCNQFYEVKQLTDVGGFPLQVSDVTLLPFRYSRFFTSSVSPSEWVQFLQEKCRIKPPLSITIDLEQFNLELASSLQQCFSLVSSVGLYTTLGESTNTLSNAYHQTTEEGFEDVLRKTSSLCHMLTSCHQLENLSISQCTPIACVTDQDQFNKVLQMCLFLPSLHDEEISYSGLFQGLKRIDMWSFRTEIELYTLCSLLAFTQNESFESICIVGPTVKCDLLPNEKEAVLQDLEHSFASPISPTCTLISLTDMKLPFFLLFWLIKKFLYSPSTVTQKLTIAALVDYSLVSSEKELKSIPKSASLVNNSSHKCMQFSRLNFQRVFVEAMSYLPSLVLKELYIDHICNSEQRGDFINTEVLGALLLALPAIPMCCIKSLSLQFRMYGAWRLTHSNESLPTMTFYKSRLIGALFKTVQELPETAVSLQCGVGSNNTELLLCSLHNEWKKNGGNVKLSHLFIYFSDTVAIGSMPDFRLSLESRLMEYPMIREIARSMDIKDRRNGTSILEPETQELHAIGK